MSEDRDTGCGRRAARRVSTTLACALAMVGASTARAVPPQAPPPPQDEAKTVDVGWPRAYTTASGARAVVHQPQVSSWVDQKQIAALAAVAYTAAGGGQPTYGTVRLKANTVVAVAERMVRFSSLAVSDMNFPSLSPDQTAELAAQLADAVPPEDRVIALDRVLASLDKSQLAPKATTGLKADPPRVFYSTTPAVLVCLDGEPIWSPIQGSDLKFAVNTNWDLFLHEPTGAYYLRNEDTWLAAPSVTGPWQAAGVLPASFAALPTDENWKDVKASLPGKRTHANETVFVSSQPAELLLLNGEPRYEPVAGTGLTWISNTDSDLFRVGKTGAVYYLVAGRWFSAPEPNGPWTFASTALPEDFKRIPRSHPRGRVLASVPGTEAAMEGVVLAGVPRVARVNARELKAPPVTFLGEAEFEPVDGTSVARARNTDKDVIRVGDRFYLCYQGVWFVALSPGGPWEVARSVAEEIYEIPPSSPSHHVTYVEVDDDEDVSDDWVTYEYYGGYCGMMVGWGCAVWGTGWTYPPYVWWRAGYPVYYPYLGTYGYGTWYNPWTGTFGASARAYGPYGGVGYGARYNAYTGTYARGAMAWGPHAGRGAADAWNPRTGTYASTRQGRNMYSSWGSTHVQRGDEWMQTTRRTNRATGTTTRTTRTDSGGAVTRRGSESTSFVAKGSDNVYAGHDGKVYQRDDGGWQQWDQGGWKSVDRSRATEADTFVATGPPRRAETRAPSATPRPAAVPPLDAATYNQLERERAARADYANRSRNFNTYRANPQPNVGGSRGGYRGGQRGGGQRGGGQRTGGGRRGGRG